MKTYANFTEACAELLKNGYDRSDSEQTAHIQDLYAKMTTPEITELLENTANYTVLAWVMGGQEVARVSAEIARNRSAADYLSIQTTLKAERDSLRAAAVLNQMSIEALTNELEAEREDHARTIRVLRNTEQMANNLRQELKEERREDHTAAEVEHLRQQVRDNETIIRALLDHIHTMNR